MTIRTQTAKGIISFGLEENDQSLSLVNSLNNRPIAYRSFVRFINTSKTKYYELSN